MSSNSCPQASQVQTLRTQPVDRYSDHAGAIMLALHSAHGRTNDFRNMGRSLTSPTPLCGYAIALPSQINTECDPTAPVRQLRCVDRNAPLARVFENLATATALRSSSSGCTTTKCASRQIDGRARGWFPAIRYNGSSSFRASEQGGLEKFFVVTAMRLKCSPAASLNDVHNRYQPLRPTASKAFGRTSAPRVGKRRMPAIVSSREVERVLRKVSQTRDSRPRPKGGTERRVTDIVARRGDKIIHVEAFRLRRYADS